jgi:predicted Zn-dependent protease
MMKGVLLSPLAARGLGILLCQLVFAGLQLRAVEPTPAKAIYNTFTDEEEMAMGRKAAEETEKQMPILDAPLLTQYLNGVGQRVAQTSRRPQLQYS